MQSLDVISVNVWQIVISLCNLVILFLLLKKFLYAPVRKVLAKREAALGERYANAKDAEEEALKLKSEWEGKMESADAEADRILKDATENAEKRGKAIIDESREVAERIVRKAEGDAVLEKKKAEAEIKKEIVDVSTAISEKVIGRELNSDDHHAIIGRFLDEIGEGDDGNK